MSSLVADVGSNAIEVNWASYRLNLIVMSQSGYPYKRYPKEGMYGRGCLK